MQILKKHITRKESKELYRLNKELTLQERSL